ncbi:MAG TPA: bacteriohemerythrin [Bacteroidales bacterium]
MAILNWNQALSVGIDSIDVQHQRLFEHINAFYDNMSKSSNKENLGILLKALGDYTVYHFNAEEKLMQQYNYPKLMEHKKEHAKFIKTIEQYKERLSLGKLIISIEITNYLKDWITDHIMVEDHKYSEYLINKEVI